MTAAFHVLFFKFYVCNLIFLHKKYTKVSTYFLTIELIIVMFILHHVNPDHPSDMLLDFI